MSKYKLNSDEGMVIIEAITFAELVKHGLENVDPSNVHNGMPWSFKYQGHSITHENDQCYLIPPISTVSDMTNKFTPNDMLITHDSGTIWICPATTFKIIYTEYPEIKLNE